MNTVIWVLAGAAIGWVGYVAMQVNSGRGLFVSLVIGAMGGFFGGNVLAPLFSSAPADPSAFSLLGFFAAVASAVGCVTIADMVYERYGV
jgi:uncharacterized membrane protein YeaQ/YmgE (transglycosylase-associated protein family)